MFSLSQVQPNIATMSSQTSQPRKTLSVGIVLVTPFQLIDAIGPAELFLMAWKEYYTASGFPALADAFDDVLIHYIGASRSPADANKFAPHSFLTVVPTCTYDAHPSFDVLLVPGPAPDYIAPPSLASFLHSVIPQTPTVLAVCSGPLVLAQLGLLNGKQATCNPEILELARKMYPKVEWQDGVRWVVNKDKNDGENEDENEDGKFWTSGGGVGAGMSMTVEFLKSDKFGLGDVVPLIGAKLIELEVLGQFRKADA
jgi:transcriptional regulator GlxA family with amidase domain